MSTSIPVWAGIDIGGSHIGASFFSSKENGASNSAINVLSLPLGIPAVFDNFLQLTHNIYVEHHISTDLIPGLYPKIDYVGETALHLEIKNLSTTGELLVHFLYILLRATIDTKLKDSEGKVGWDLKGVGIGCPGIHFAY